MQNEPITIYGDGEQTRDFIYVDDIVSALCFAAQDNRMQGVFNCGYGRNISINRLAGKILEVTGSKSQVNHAPQRIGDVRHSLAGVDRLFAQGWLPSHNFDFGLVNTIKYFRKLNGA